MAPYSRSTSPVGLTVHERQETFFDEDVANFLSGLFSDTANPPLPEVSPASSSDDKVPQEVDILCGKGKEALGHLGNRKYRKLISSYRNDYQNPKANNYTKSKITKAVLASIRGKKGRFLKKDEQTDTWYEVDYNLAYDKVSHALRSAKYPEKISQRKKPKVREYPPKPEQDSYFQRLFADQQKIFRELLYGNHKSENFEVDEEWSGISV
jgi:hypothetical protein